MGIIETNLKEIKPTQELGPRMSDGHHHSKTLRTSLVVQTVTPKGNQPRIFIGRTDAKVEASVLWPPDAKSRLTGKDPDAGKDGRQKEKGMTENKMVGWHHRLKGHESAQTPEDGRGQGSLACCRPQGHRELDMT